MKKPQIEVRIGIRRGFDQNWSSGSAVLWIPGRDANLRCDDKYSRPTHERTIGVLPRDHKGHEVTQHIQMGSLAPVSAQALSDLVHARLRVDTEALRNQVAK